MRQTYYLEITGIQGRIDIHILEFGAAFELDMNGGGGRGTPRGKLASPARMYFYSSFAMGNPLGTHLKNHYHSLENASTNEQRLKIEIPEVLIRVETKQDGKVSLDTVYKLKGVQITDGNLYGEVPWMKMFFSDSEKLWRTWD